MPFLRTLTDRVKTKTVQLASSKTIPANDFVTAPEGKLFPQTNPVLDGEDCLHDCETCTVELPAKFSIDEDDHLYGMVKGWNTHLIVATGKSDWVRDVADEKGSIMEAVDRGAVQPSNGKLMLSASNMPVPDSEVALNGSEICSTVLLLPAFVFIDNVKPSNVPQLITHVINNAPTNTSPLDGFTQIPPSIPQIDYLNGIDTDLRIRRCPHRYLILLCSQKTRDARCGQSAPLLRREFERHLRPLGLYRDAHDERPGGASIVFISHVGGHKYSANVFVYRRADVPGETDGEVRPGAGEASQCIWLARVRPEDCENIVKFTMLQGKVVKPDRQLRGGFDRCKQLVSW